MVTGSDDWRYTVYGFVDTELDGLLTDLDPMDLTFDQVAAGAIEANKPIWRPRGYWVKILDVRIEQVRREYEYLASTLKLAVKIYVRS